MPVHLITPTIMVVVYTCSLLLLLLLSTSIVSFAAAIEPVAPDDGVDRHLRNHAPHEKQKNILSVGPKRSPRLARCKRDGERIMNPKFGAGLGKTPGHQSSRPDAARDHPYFAWNPRRTGIVKVENGDKVQLDRLKTDILMKLEQMNVIMRKLLDKPPEDGSGSQVIQAKIVAECPGNGGDAPNGVIEIIGLKSDTEAAFDSFFDIWVGEADDGGGGGGDDGGSGGCYDQEAGVCCPGPCPC